MRQDPRAFVKVNVPHIRIMEGGDYHDQLIAGRHRC